MQNLSGGSRLHPQRPQVFQRTHAQRADQRSKEPKPSWQIIFHEGFTSSREVAPHHIPKVVVLDLVWMDGKEITTFVMDSLNMGLPVPGQRHRSNTHVLFCPCLKQNIFQDLPTGVFLMHGSGFLVQQKTPLGRSKFWIKRNQLSSRLEAIAISNLTKKQHIFFEVNSISCLRVRLCLSTHLAALAGYTHRGPTRLWRLDHFSVLPRSRSALSKRWGSESDLGDLSVGETAAKHWNINSE